MRLEDIREMETDPFDEDVLEQVYFQRYDSYAEMPDGFAALIFYYFKKFDERYGTRLIGYLDAEQILPGFIDEIDQELWTENAEYLFDRALFESGWDIAILITDSEELHTALEERGDSEEACYVELEEYLSNYFNDGFVISCFLQQAEEILDMASCMDEGEMVVIWNRDLERYRRYRRENEEVIAAICPEEDCYITALDKSVWNPFMVSYDQKTAICEDMKYGAIMLGCNGYSYCALRDIDPNWIPKAIKIGWMLRLAWEKIDCYECAKQSKPAV